MIKKYLVNVPVTDLRREPIPLRNQCDPLQETQLLFNERLLGLAANNGWVCARAIEQPKCLANCEWSGYPGWVRADHLIEVAQFTPPTLSVQIPWATLDVPLSMGTLLTGVKEESGVWKVRLPDGSQGRVAKEAVKPLKRRIYKGWRNDLLQRGTQLIEAPYFWGGRSATSLDCSGLVELLFRVQGISLPRDAHDQFLRCAPRSSLEIGDLIFLAPVQKPARISHVMLYAGDEMLLEAEQRAGKVRLVSTKNKLGIAIQNLPWGFNNGEYFIYKASLTEK